MFYKREGYYICQGCVAKKKKKRNLAKSECEATYTN